ncbi:hypothetical protein ACIRO3_30180 [Streptomyces sp. NPDC102278]|uniref:hypothetical protein n=1 Tax=Streptomyces sp. NPDC102278 TaxID=3366152 RepID=UPI00380302F0
MGLYVETVIDADMEVLWERTQDPARHQSWDLRFTSISYLPRVEGEPPRFRYATRLLSALWIAGTGVSGGERQRPDGTRVSARRFASDHPLSLLADAGLARAAAASFVGIELYEGVDPEGAARALDSLEQLAVLAQALEGLGPLSQRAVTHQLRRRTRD